VRRPFVAGNWKMNGSLSSLSSLVGSICEGHGRKDLVDVAICPPFVYLTKVIELTRGTVVGVGGQSLAKEEPGAFTGEVAGEMLKDIGCTYVIVGHSERRSLYGEDDQRVADKYARALACGLTPILCVGEQREDRERGATESVVGAQLQAVLGTSGADGLGQGIIAYEPVWAIGTGLTATPDEAQAVHAFIRRSLATQSAAVAENTRILYGGSVKPGNAAELFAMADIDGGLIGGAALVAEDFLGICAAA